MQDDDGRQVGQMELMYVSVEMLGSSGVYGKP